MWVLGIELGALGLVASTVPHCAILQRQSVYYYETHFKVCYMKK